VTIEIIATINSDGARRGADQLNRALASSTGHVQRFDNNILSLNRALGLLGGYLSARALYDFGKAAIGAADDFTRLEARLTAIGTGGFTAEAVMQSIADAADRARVPVNDLTDVYARNATALERLGYGQSEAVRIAETMSKLGALSGSSAESVSKALFQISQGLNSGALRAEEFNSMAEQTPEIMRAMADALGVTVGELRKAAAEGKITGETIADAMLYASQTTDERFGKMGMTVDQSLTLLSNSFTTTWGRISKEIGVTETWSNLIKDFTAALEGPVGRDVLSLFANGLNLIASAARGVGDAIKFARDSLNNDLSDWQAQLGGMGVVTPVDGFGSISGSAAGLLASGAQTNAVPLFGRSTNPQRDRPKFGTGTENDTEAKAIERTIARAKELAAIEDLRNAVTRAKIDGEFEVARQLEKQIELEARITPEMEKRAPIEAALLRTRIESGIELERQLEEQSRLIAANKAFAEELSSTLVNGFYDAAKAGESFKDTLRGIGADLIEIIAKAAFLDPLQKSLSSSISGSLGGFDFGSITAGLSGGFAFAKGGVLNSPAQFTSGGMKGIAGEAGPEAILPLRRGANGSLGVVAQGGGGGGSNIYITIEGDATDSTVAKMERVARQVFAQQSPGIVANSVSAVRRENLRDRNYMRR
jgi:tape measure domain-containing protein